MTAFERTPLLADAPPQPDATWGAEPPSAVVHQERLGMSDWDFRWLLAGLWILSFTASLDSTIVATLTSSIGSSFDSMNSSGWIGASYLLSVCCFTPCYGRLCGVIGRRGAALTSAGLFGFGTCLCGLCTNMTQLIAARALAGMGGGGLAVVNSVIVSDLVSLKERGLYQGLTNLLFGLGAGVGGPLGGWIADTLGWRAAFLLQSPLVIAALFILWLKIREPPNVIEAMRAASGKKWARIDALGSFTLVVAVGGLLLGFSFQTDGAMWADFKVWGLLIVSAVFTVLFVFVELRAVEPVLPFSMLKRRTPLFVAINNFLLAIVSFSILYNVPLYFTAVRLTSAGNAGAHLIPNSISIATGSLFAGWWMRRTGRYWYLQLIGGAGTVGATVLLFNWDFDTPEWLLYVSMVPSGLGMAITLTTTLLALIASVERDEIAVATGVSYLFRTTGQVLGVSLTSALSQHVLAANLRARIIGPDAEETIRQILASTSYIQTLPKDVRLEAQKAWALSLKVVFACQVVGAVCIFLTLLPVEELHLPGTTAGTPVKASTPAASVHDAEADVAGGPESE